METVINTVGDLRQVLGTNTLVVDFWAEDVGVRLLLLSPQPTPLAYSFGVASGEDAGVIFVSSDLITAVHDEPDDKPVQVLGSGGAMRLIAVGVSGENTDFSFNLVPVDAP